MSDSNTPDLPEGQLPQEVVAALRQRNGAEIEIPGSLEAAILADAEKHLTGVSRRIPTEAQPRPLHQLRSLRGSRWVAWSAGTVAAAMLLFAVLPRTPEPARLNVGISTDAIPAPDTAVTVASAAPEFTTRDIDGNGQINILDAFALARTMNAGDVDGIQWDQNDDGQLNQADVNLVARTAVTL